MSTQLNKYSLFSRLKYSFFIFWLIGLSASAEQPVVASYYFANGSPISVSNLPAEKLSHVIYAFVALCGDNSGANETTQKAITIACKGKAPYSAVLYNEKEVIAELDAFRTLKQKYPHLHILPSFGGWTLSQPFHGMAKSVAARKHFVESAVALITQHDVFDGIDIDWEYPGGGGNSQIVLKGAQAQNEKQVFTLLMQELRAQLDTLKQNTGREYQLTAAVSGTNAKTQAIDWQKTIPFMDYVFAMTYDFAVGDGQAGHHANLFSSDDNGLSAENMINNLIDAGVPANKLAVGIAFYSRGWTNSGWQDADDSQGMGLSNKRFDDTSQSISTKGYAYKELITNPPVGYEYGYDSEAEAAYFFNTKTKGFITFDDKRSTLAKTNWARSKGLAGVFSWQILQDNGDLLNAMYQGMHSQDKNDAGNNTVEAKH